MRKCSKCKKNKPIEEYNFKNKVIGIYSLNCKSCSRQYIKDHYWKNRDYYIKKAKRRNAQIRRQIKNYILSYLSIHPCIDCGEKDTIVLEFDHIRDKKFTISAFARNHKLEDVKSEIEKCEIRCANCHRRKTAKQYGWDKRRLPL